MTQPQAAFTALTKSLHLQRVMTDCSDLFVPLHRVLFDFFLPAVFGMERQLFSLPIYFGGLGVFIHHILWGHSMML